MLTNLPLPLNDFEFRFKDELHYSIVKHSMSAVSILVSCIFHGAYRESIHFTSGKEIVCLKYYIVKFTCVSVCLSVCLCPEYAPKLCTLR